MLLSLRHMNHKLTDTDYRFKCTLNDERRNKLFSAAESLGMTASQLVRKMIDEMDEKPVTSRVLPIQLSPQTKAIPYKGTWVIQTST